jgi:hypothetical protein
MASVTTEARGRTALASPPLNESLAWAWTDFAGRAPLPLWALALLLLAVMFATNGLIALAFGELANYIEDYRRFASYLICASYSMYLVYLPRAVNRIWTTIRPWLDNPEAEVEALEASTRPVFARYFFPIAAIWALFSAFWAATASWGEVFDNSLVPALLNAWHGIFLTYFVGAGNSFGVGGTWSLVHLLGSKLDFRPGLILEGGKGVLAPFNQLFLITWLFAVFVLSLTTIGTTPITRQGLRTEDIVLWTVIALLILVLIQAQRSLNALLTREKQTEVARIRAELAEARRLPDDPEPVQVLVSMHKAQFLQNDLQRAEAFHPTLLDTRFAVQIGLSVTAILIANVLLRTVLEGLI